MTASAERRRRLGAVGMAATALAGCKSPSRPPLPPQPVEVRVTLDEYRFEFEPPLADIRGKAVVFRAHNRGRVDHQLSLVPLPEDLVGRLDAQVKGPERRYVPPMAALRPRKPGQSGFFAVDLKPGAYGVVCVLTDADGSRHAAKGMNAEFRMR